MAQSQGILAFMIFSMLLIANNQILYTSLPNEIKLIIIGTLIAIMYSLASMTPGALLAKKGGVYFYTYDIDDTFGLWSYSLIIPIISVINKLHKQQ